MLYKRFQALSLIITKESREVLARWAKALSHSEAIAEGLETTGIHARTVNGTRVY